MEILGLDGCGQGGEEVLKQAEAVLKKSLMNDDRQTGVSRLVAVDLNSYGLALPCARFQVVNTVAMLLVVHDYPRVVSDAIPQIPNLPKLLPNLVAYV